MLNYISCKNHRRRSLPLILFMWTVLLLLPSTADAYDPHLRFPWPAGVPHGILSQSSTYNCYRHVNIDYYAIDFDLYNENVTAAQGGQVIRHPFDSNYGWYLDINHGNGFMSRYAHLRPDTLTSQNTVNQGDVIATSSNTGGGGETLGFHLHFAVYLNGQAYMPEPMFAPGPPNLPPVPVTGFGNYGNGACKTGAISSDTWNSAVPVSQVLKNRGFDDPGAPVMAPTGPWNTTGGISWEVLPGSGDGSNYLALNRDRRTAGSVFQDFSLESSLSNYPNDLNTNNRTFITPPDTWSFRVWIRAFCNSGYATGTLAAWARGRPAPYNLDNEAGTSAFTANSGWQQFTVTTRFGLERHNQLAVEVFTDNAACEYDIDDASFMRNYINNSSFESQYNYWTLFNNNPNCTANWVPYTNASAKDNNWYMEANRGTCTNTVEPITIYQFVTVYPQVNDVFGVRLWVRLPEGAGGVVGV